MKTKSLFIALTAALCILSGCSKDKNTDSSLLTEFKRAESYIDQDTTTVINQITKLGYRYVNDTAGYTLYGKVSGNDRYVYGIKASATGAISTVDFLYITPNMNDYLSNSAFADFVRYLGKSYKATFNETYDFEVCYYGEDEEECQIHTFEALDSALVNLVNEKDLAITWRNGNNHKLAVGRGLDVDGNVIDFSINK